MGRKKIKINFIDFKIRNLQKVRKQRKNGTNKKFAI